MAVSTPFLSYGLIYQSHWGDQSTCASVNPIIASPEPYHINNIDRSNTLIGFFTGGSLDLGARRDDFVTGGADELISSSLHCSSTLGSSWNSRLLFEFLGETSFTGIVDSLRIADWSILRWPSFVMWISTISLNLNQGYGCLKSNLMDKLSTDSFEWNPCSSSIDWRWVRSYRSRKSRRSRFDCIRR